MRYLVLSDVHANHVALAAVLASVRRKRFDAVLHLGDAVGYGAEPNQAVQRLRRMRRTVHHVRGNHDKVVTGIDDGASFNDVALAAARWTTGRLSRANLGWVRELPRGPLVVAPELAICHGSPLDEDQYLFSDYDAELIFAGHDVQVTFFGHTHIPSAFIESPHGLEVVGLRGSGRMEILPGHRYLLNPGSIGQPRDRDPRAAFMTYDTERKVVRWYRVEYDVAAAQRKIRATGLPDVLAERLGVGA